MGSYNLVTPPYRSLSPQFLPDTGNRYNSPTYRPNALFVVDFTSTPPSPPDLFVPHMIVFEWDVVDTFDSAELRTIIRPTIEIPSSNEYGATVIGVAYVDRSPILIPDTGYPTSDEVWYMRASAYFDPDVPPPVFTSPTHEIRPLDTINRKHRFYIFDNPEAGQPCPTITSISPAVTYEGQNVTIRGEGFGATQGTWNGEMRIYDREDLVGTYVALAVQSWSDTEIVAQVPIDSGYTSGWVSLFINSVLHDCSNSAAMRLNVIGAASDAENGWYVKTADYSNQLTQQATIIPANVSSAAFMSIMNGVGSGQIEIPLGDPDIENIIDPFSLTGRLIRVYTDGRMRYGFFAEKLTHDYDDEGNAVVMISGRGMEAVASWSPVLTQDFPISPSQHPKWSWGSNENLLTNPNFDDVIENPIVRNPDGEEGNDEVGRPVGWNPRGDAFQSAECVQDPATARTGEWRIAVNTTAHHAGLEQSVPVTENKVYYVETWVKAQTGTGMRITLSLGGADDISSTGKYTDTKYSDEILVELDNASPSGNGCPGGATNGDWQRMRSEIRTGDKQTSLVVAIQDDHHTSCAGDRHDVFWIDDLEISGWGLGLDGWVPYSASNHASSSFRLQRDVTPADSEYGLYLNLLAKPGGIAQLVDVEPNTLYTASILVKTWNPTGDYTLRIRKNNGLETNVVWEKKTPRNGVWTKYEVQFYTGQLDRQVFFQFYYDDVGNPPPIYCGQAKMLAGPPAATAGTILNTLLDVMGDPYIPGPYYTKMGYVTRTFTDTHDSAGVEWTSKLAMDIEPDETLAGVLARLVALGHEWEIVPQNHHQGGDDGFELNVYVARAFVPAGGLGTNHTLVHDGPVLLSSDSVVSGRVVKNVFKANTVVAIGNEGVITRASQFPWTDLDDPDPDVIGYTNAYGVIEEVINVNSDDDETVHMFAQARLAESKADEVILQLDLQRGSALQPFVDFDKGDTIFVDIPGIHPDPPLLHVTPGNPDTEEWIRSHPKRIRAIQADLAGEGSDVTFTVDVDRVLYEQELAWYAAIAQLQERAPTDNQTTQGMGALR